MAKGLRSSTKKSNRTKLRSRVFEPVESARAERIHAKLLELVQQPKPEPQKKADMELDSAEATTAVHDTTKDDDYPKDMEVDDDGTTSTVSKTMLKKRAERAKAKHPRRQKPRNTISFPKSRGKGALKPFSDSRVRKQRRS